MPVLFSIIVGAALAQDIVPEVVDVSELPDLLEALGSKRPVMGECPLGTEGMALPPADHLLHLGTTGFYLDYEKRLDLDEEQVEALTAIRDDALGRGALLDAQLEAKEAELWVLTGAPQRDQEAITSVVKEIETLHVERRLLYIDAISHAAETLRPEQVALLVGS